MGWMIVGEDDPKKQRQSANNCCGVILQPMRQFAGLINREIDYLFNTLFIGQEFFP